MKIFFLLEPYWTAISAVATMGGTFVALVLGVYNIRIVATQNFFKEIKKYFNEGIKDLNDVIDSDFKNNFIKWHRALSKILAAQHLACNLKTLEYKILYVYLCQQIAFEFYNVNQRIVDYKFFFGVEDYKDSEDEKLFQVSYPAVVVSVDEKYSAKRRDEFRIAPDLLSFIVRFLQNSDQYGLKLVSDMSKKEINSFLNPLETVELKQDEYDVPINSNIGRIVKYIGELQKTRKKRWDKPE